MLYAVIGLVLQKTFSHLFASFHNVIQPILHLIAFLVSFIFLIVIIVLLSYILWPLMDISLLAFLWVLKSGLVFSLSPWRFHLKYIAYLKHNSLPAVTHGLFDCNLFCCSRSFPAGCCRLIFLRYYTIQWPSEWMSRRKPNGCISTHQNSNILHAASDRPTYLTSSNLFIPLCLAVCI